MKTTIRIGGLYDDNKVHQAGSIWSKEGLSPTIDTSGGGYRMPLIMVKYEHNSKRNEGWDKPNN